MLKWCSGNSCDLFYSKLHDDMLLFTGASKKLKLNKTDGDSERCTVSRSASEPGLGAQSHFRVITNKKKLLEKFPKKYLCMCRKRFKWVLKKICICKMYAKQNTASKILKLFDCVFTPLSDQMVANQTVHSGSIHTRIVQENCLDWGGTTGRFHTFLWFSFHSNCT